MDMTQNVPIPASTARQLSEDVEALVEDIREDGYYHSADRAERCAKEVREAADETKGGRFVSVDGHALSAVASYGTVDNSTTARVFLEQYGVW